MAHMGGSGAALWAARTHTRLGRAGRAHGVSRARRTCGSRRGSPPLGSRALYARAQAAGVACVPLLVETFGGLSPALMQELQAAAEWRSNKLTSSEYDETTWSARTWLTFVAQRRSASRWRCSSQWRRRLQRRSGCRWRPTPERGERPSGGHRGLVLPT